MPKQPKLDFNWSHLRHQRYIDDHEKKTFQSLCLVKTALTAWLNKDTASTSPQMTQSARTELAVWFQKLCSSDSGVEFRGESRGSLEAFRGWSATLADVPTIRWLNGLAEEVDLKLREIDRSLAVKARQAVLSLKTLGIARHVRDHCTPPEVHSTHVLLTFVTHHAVQSLLPGSFTASPQFSIQQTLRDSFLLQRSSLLLLSPPLCICAGGLSSSTHQCCSV